MGRIALSEAVSFWVFVGMFCGVFAALCFDFVVCCCIVLGWGLGFVGWFPPGFDSYREFFGF